MRNRGRTKLIVHTHTCMDIVRISIFKSRKWCRHRSEQRSARMIINPFVIVRTAATANYLHFRNCFQKHQSGERGRSWQCVDIHLITDWARVRIVYEFRANLSLECFAWSRFRVSLRRRREYSPRVIRCDSTAPPGVVRKAIAK